MNLIHVCLYVSDAATSVEWYENQLGFEETLSFESEDGSTVNRYVAGPNGVEPPRSDTEGEGPTTPGDAMDHIAVGVDDVDVAFEKIDHYGVVEEPRDQPAAGAKTAFFKDPDGYIIEFVQPLED
jgi:lactoylglutathione lyase